MKADQGMGADAVGQSVMNRRNLDVGFQHAKATHVGTLMPFGEGRQPYHLGRHETLRHP